MRKQNTNDASSAQNGAPKSQTSRADNKSATSPQPAQMSFLVKANVGLACAAEFVVHAATKTEAEKVADEVLDAAVFKISADSASGPDMFVNIPDYCIDSFVVEVEPFEPGWLFDSEAVQANAVASIGTLIFKEIERLAQSCPQGGDREPTRFAFVNGMSEDFFEKLWGIYTKFQSRNKG